MGKWIDEIVSDAKFVKNHELQPGWYKTLKIFLVLGLLLGHCLLFGIGRTLVFCAVFFSLSLGVHFLYRIKTAKFTHSWLDFIVREQDGQLRYDRIGLYYYLMVMINLILAVVVSQILP